MRVRFAFAFVGAALAVAQVAAAAPEETSPAPPSPPQWSLGMVGGVLQPLGAMRDSHHRGLDAGVRIAWTSRIGLGVEVAVDYSPLPHALTIDGGRFDTIYTTAAIGPRFAAGWSFLRFALEAGGGVAIDHTTNAALIVPVTTTETDLAPAAQLGLEIEVPVVSGGGIMLTGGGTRAFGALGYEYAWAMGGLALSF